MPKRMPKFKNEDEEGEFWAAHDGSECLDWEPAQRAVFPNLKPSTRTISLRLTENMLAQLRQLANKQDVPYQLLIKTILRERLDHEYRRQ